MTARLRTLIGIAAGFIVALGVSYLAAIAVLLLTIGIPLGSVGRPLTTIEYGMLLGLAAIAAAIGGRVTARIARHSRVAVAVLCVLLAAFMVWGFSGRNAWPALWGPLSAATVAAGAWLGGRGRRTTRSCP